MRDSFTILRPQPGTIIIRHSTTRARLELAMMIGTVVIWYSFMAGRFAEMLPVTGDAETTHLILMFLPVTAIPYLFQLVRTSLNGRTYELNGETRSVVHNGREIAGAGDVQRIVVRTMQSEGAETYSTVCR